MNKHFVASASYFKFVTRSTHINAMRSEVEALGFRFYGRTFVAPFGEDIWIDNNGDLAYAMMRNVDGEVFYGFSPCAMYDDRTKWVVNEPAVAASNNMPIKVKDVVQVKRVGKLASYEGVRNQNALAVVVHVDGHLMTVVWRGRYANVNFDNHAVVAIKDATLILSV